MRLTLMHNPEAGDGTPAEKVLMAALREAGYSAKYQSTKADDYKAALEDPGEMVVVAGGDGTVAKVALQLIDQPVPIALLPLGSANNIAKSLGINGSFDELIRGWETARRKSVDTGIAAGPWGERKFIEAAGFGIIPRMINQGDAKKKGRGQDGEPGKRERSLTDGLEALEESIASFAGLDLQVSLDDRDLSGRYLLLEAMNMATVGPNLTLAPGADPGDGFLDLVLVKEEERDQLVRFFEARLRGKENRATLPTMRGRCLQVCGEKPECHFDDESWPDKEKGLSGISRPAAFPRVVVDILVKKHALQFLVPP